MKIPATLIAATALLAVPALAQTNPGLMLVPWAPETNVQLSGSAFVQDTESSQTGLDADFAIFDAAGRFRLDGDSSLDPTLGFDYTHLEIDTADAALPEHLVDVSLAFGGRLNEIDLGETLGGTWQWGYTLGFGYAGTAPFADGDAWYGLGSIYGVLPFDRDARLVVALEYDGNRVFLPDVPLPAITYFDRLNEEVTYGLGFPFSNLTWTPNDRWTLRITSFVFVSAEAKVTYRATDDLELFAAYDSRSEAFQLANDNGSRRLIFEQQRLEAGVNYKLGGRWELTAAGGYAFDQEFDRGYDIRETTSIRDLDDGGYFRLGINLRF
ncbi:MAG: hypothetical protein AAGC44_13580 [Planctomycetota bacterium]